MDTLCICYVATEIRSSSYTLKNTVCWYSLNLSHTHKRLSCNKYSCWIMQSACSLDRSTAWRHAHKCTLLLCLLLLSLLSLLSQFLFCARLPKGLIKWDKEGEPYFPVPCAPVCPSWARANPNPSSPLHVVAPSPPVFPHPWLAASPSSPILSVSLYDLRASACPDRAGFPYNR